MNDWRWDADTLSYPPFSGDVRDMGQAEDRPAYPCAALWLPDPDARRGWRERAVWPQGPERERRKLGW